MEKKRRRDMKSDWRTLAFWESSQCVTLVAVKDLLRHISCCDRMPPSRVTGIIFVSTQSGDLVFSSLNLGQASFDIEAQSFSL